MFLKCFFSIIFHFMFEVYSEACVWPCHGQHFQLMGFLKFLFSFLISLKCFITFLVIQLGTYLESSRYTILFKCAMSLILQTSNILKVATQKCADDSHELLMDYTCTPWYKVVQAK